MPLRPKWIGGKGRGLRSFWTCGMWGDGGGGGGRRDLIDCGGGEKLIWAAATFGLMSKPWLVVGLWWKLVIDWLV